MNAILIAGQSNAVGTSPTGGLKGYVFPNVKLYQCGEFIQENSRLQNRWLNGVRPGMGYTPLHGGLELGVCDYFKNAPPYAIVRYAYGTTDLWHDWKSESLWKKVPASPKDEGYHYLRWKNTLAAALAEGQPLRIAGLIYMQGESDAYSKSGAENYDKNLGALFSDMRAAAGDPRMKILVGEIATAVSAYAPYSDIVREKQRSYCETDRDAVLVESKDLPLADGWHYTIESAIELGRRFASALSRFL